MKSFQHKIPVYLFILLATAVACDTTPTQVEEPIEYSHTLKPGDANEDLLTDREFHRVIVEINYMPGHKPAEEAMDHLKEFLKRWLQKSEIIIETPSQIPSGGQQTYSEAEVRQLEKEHRTSWSDPGQGTLATYNLILDGEYEANNNVLGIAYYNTSNAYFGATFERISGGLGQPSRQDVEATVWRHEYGHLMGLVNNGTDMQEGHHHQDTPNGAHCTQEECVMYYAFRSADLFSTIFGQEIPDLKEFCQADIAALQAE